MKCLDSKRTRRAFSAQAISFAAACASAPWTLAAQTGGPAVRAADWQQRLAMARRLFCVAYITPNAPGQGGQERAVARYPLALVPQDARPMFREWRDQVRSLNPDIVLVGYQITIEEGTVPGPGHDILRSAQDCWVQDSSGVLLTVGPAGKRRRVYDPRKPQWRTRFVEACSAVMEAGHFEGLFLDQCTIYDRAGATAADRTEMRAALDEALTELRRRQPRALIIANSSFSLPCVNGELNESRPQDYAKELAAHAGLTQPRVDLAHQLIASAADRSALQTLLKDSLGRGAYFGASRDYQHVEWYPEFDELPAVPKAPTLKTAGAVRSAPTCEAGA